MNLLPLHDSEGGGGGQSSRSQGLPGPTTACEAQQATASIAAPPPEKDRPGHAGSSRNGSLLASSKPTDTLNSMDEITID
jgi:hypothetical protein